MANMTSVGNRGPSRCPVGDCEAICRKGGKICRRLSQDLGRLAALPVLSLQRIQPLGHAGSATLVVPPARLPLSTSAWLHHPFSGFAEQHTCSGVDVSKDRIDVFDPTTARHKRIPSYIRSLRKLFATVGSSIDVLEAAGGCERLVMNELSRTGRHAVRETPRAAREFARETGRLAKSERVDALGLAELGRALPVVRDIYYDENRGGLPEDRKLKHGCDPEVSAPVKPGAVHQFEGRVY